jgi:hypothetical protein
MSDLPFTYLDKKAVLAACPFKSNSNLAVKIKAGEFPAPDHICGRAMWRSDRLAQWLTEQGEKADAEREERNRKAQEKAQRMVAARCAATA